MMDLWMIANDEHVRTALASINALDLARRSSSFSPPPRAPAYTVRGRAAHVAVRGTLIPNGPDWFEEFGLMPMRLVRERIRAADADSSVDEIVLLIDSPGGTVAGLEALVATVRALKKPSTSLIETLGASAAYWLASATRSITAEPGAIVGSIGVIASVVDASKYFENNGLKLHVIRTAPAKGGIQWGEEVTAENLAPIRARVTEAFAAFTDAVRAGRNLDGDRLEAVTTGETWTAARALALGLVDAIRLTDDPAEVPTDAPFPIAASAAEETMSISDTKITDETKAALQRAEAAEAKAAALEAQLRALSDTAKTQLIEQAVADGRVLPAARARVEKYAEFAALADLKAFLESFPVSVNTNPVGNVPSRPAASSGANPLETLPESDRKYFEERGIADVIKLGMSDKPLRSA